MTQHFTIPRHRAAGLLAALALSLFATLPASADTLADIKARGKVLIAIDLAVPPYGMSDASMKPTGSDVETAELLAKDLGVKLEIVQVTGPNRIPFLLTGKADMVISSFSVSDERKKVIDFSDPYGMIQTVVAGPKDMAIKGYEALAGKRVAVTRGTTNDAEATANAKGAQIVRFDDDATLITALVSGQADLVATAPALLATINAKNPPKQLDVKFVMRTFPYAIGLRKNDPALLTWLNTWVKTNLKNGKLNDIYKKYQGVSLPESMLK